jgi:transcriptional regulator with XRE-family HTH domain
MTPEQYKATRKAIGLKQHELAERLGVTRETVCNRERGTAIIGSEAAMALQWLAGVKDIESQQTSNNEG